MVLSGGYFLSKNITETKQSQIRTSLQNNLQKIDTIAHSMEQKADELALFGSTLSVHNKKNTFSELNKITENYLTQSFKLFPDSIGGGIWFEPFSLVENQKYYGPYAYIEKGRVYFTWDLSKASYNYFDWDWYTVALPKNWDRTKPRPQKNYWSAPYKDGAGTIQLLITVASIIHNSSGKIIGVSTVDWSVERLLSIVEEHKPTPNSHTFVVDNKSGLILLYTIDHSKKLDRLQNVALLNQIFDSLNTRTIKIENEIYLLMTSKTHNDMTYGVLVPEKDIFGYRNTILWGEMVAIFFFTSLFYLIYLKIVERLKNQIDSRTKHLEKNKKELVYLNQKLHLMINATTDSILQLDIQGNILMLNDSAAKRLGSTVEQLLGAQLSDQLEECYVARQKVIIEKVFFTGKAAKIEDARDGYFFLIDYYPIFKEENVESVVVFAHDITEQKKSQMEIEHLAFHDFLTQLPNRRLFIDRLEYTLTIMTRSRSCAAVLFMDLDNFKPLNDLYGHAIGDLILQETATRLQEGLRDSDVVSRFGGDEFVILLTNLSNSHDEARTYVLQVAEKIRLKINEVYKFDVQKNNHLEQTEHSCHVSIGISLFCDPKINPEYIIGEADKAMYEAKEQGKNRIVMYDIKSI